MLKKAFLVLIPFILLFLFGVILLIRPHDQVRIIEVTDTFTRQEKTGMRSSHRHTVDYANVIVEVNGTQHVVTVHDHTWDPLKAGDSVVVTTSLGGKIVEYKTENAYRLMAFAAIMGSVVMGLFVLIARRRRKTMT
ncbi:MAG: hypothetical protein IJ719_05355 [Clostridia bacterium]|nr:hypothetical protein [Clostridia bacterium]